MRRLLLTAIAASLAACGAEPRQETTDGPAPAPEGSPLQNSPSDEAANGPAAADNESVATPATVIPAALHGRWGLVPADCTSTRGDAKGLLRIDGQQLRFYESRATLTRIVEADASRIVADFAFTGEGQTWWRRLILDAQDDGQTLIRREVGEGGMPGALRYRKCGA